MKYSTEGCKHCNTTILRQVTKTINLRGVK